MRTFKCTGCYECCYVTIQFGANPPCRCHHDDNKSNWHEVKKEKQKLPRLTTDIFNHPACPKNVQYVVVTSGGGVNGYTDKPYINTFYNMHKELTQCWGFNSGCKFTISVDGTFDSSDWQSSLIERPVKTELPYWCRVGEWVYDASLGEYIYVREEDYDWYVDPVARGRIKQARKRAFNDEEMKALVGKVIEDPNIVLLVESYGKFSGDIGTYCGTYTAEALMDNGFVANGKPCYKLEHLNDKGKWVE